MVKFQLIWPALVFMYINGIHFDADVWKPKQECQLFISSSKAIEKIQIDQFACVFSQQINLLGQMIYYDNQRLLINSNKVEQITSKGIYLVSLRIQYKMSTASTSAFDSDVLSYVLLTFLGKLSNQAVYAQIQQMHIDLLISFEGKGCFGIVVSQSPVENNQVKLLADLLDFLRSVILRNADADHILHQVTSESLAIQTFRFIEEMHDWQFQLAFAQMPHDRTVERLQDYGKSIQKAFLFSVQTTSFQNLYHFLNDHLILDVISVFPEALDFNQEAALVVWETLLFYMLYFSDGVLEGGYSESRAIDLGSLLKRLFYLQMVQLFECKIIYPPILPSTLSLLDFIGSYSLFVSEDLMILNVSKSTHVTIMEDDNLLIFGEKDVNLDKVRFVEGSFNALKSVLGKES